MRVLLLIRGAPGVGKSTWIREHGLQNYTLCADDIRMQCAAPTLNVQGKMVISQNNDMIVWKTLFSLLEVRMANGEFTVIDATNSKTSEMNRYKELATFYKYRMYCVDFTGVPMEVAMQRNRDREPLKWVPDEVIEKCYSRFVTQRIPAGITVIQPDELYKLQMNPIDLSQYKAIHHIGDIHGCNTALQEYFKREGGMKEDEFYIFVGDYIDRGLENADVLNFMLKVYERKNVMVLEGNHEKALQIWASGGVAPSKEFEMQTKAQLEDAQIDKKEIRKLYRKMGQCAYYTYNGETVLVTHAGLSALPADLIKVATRSMMYGVGTYGEVESVDSNFAQSTDCRTIQIHGHRNPKGLPIAGNGDRTFNLEGNVEHGGSLRCVKLYMDGICVIHEPVAIANSVFKPAFDKTQASVEAVKLQNTVADVVLDMRQNKYINEKRFGNISSFNFSKMAFMDKIWNEQTVLARGLYINIPLQKIVARAYNKFFNVNERPETKLEMLQYKLAFPVTAYVKENGFLGIVSYNDETDDLFITTKSNPDGDYACWLRNSVETNLNADQRNTLKEYCKERGVSFVFECVDMVHDPHIVEYRKNELFLLDVIENTIEFKKMPYANLCEIAQRFGLHVKEKACVIESWPEFFDWYYTVVGEDYLYHGRRIEGFVVEDSAGYMVKLKLAYYNFWKFMRGVAHETLRNGYLNPRKTSALTTPLANMFYGWLKGQYNREDKDTLPKDICSLRKMFYQSEEGKRFIE